MGVGLYEVLTHNQCNIFTALPNLSDEELKLLYRSLQSHQTSFNKNSNFALQNLVAASLLLPHSFCVCSWKRGSYSVKSLQCIRLLIYLVFIQPLIQFF